MQDRYLMQSEVFERLKEEYLKYDTLYIAFDFDNTVYDYHNVGDTYCKVVEVLRKCKHLGFKLILFTANDDPDKLIWMQDYCKKYGFEPDYINESPIIPTKKPYYNILLDDRAGLHSATLSLIRLLRYIELRKNKN